MKYPYTIYWEYPYRSNKYLHSDLALLKEDGAVLRIFDYSKNKK